MSTFRGLAPRTGDQTVLATCIVLIAAGAWLALWLFEGSIHGLFHHGLGHHAKPSAAVMLLFVGGWAVMTVAMMLPTSLPVITVFHTIAGRRGDRAVLVALVILGYLAVWTAFGVLVYLGIVLWHWLLTASPWMENYAWAGTPLILLAAGLFQFTPLKYRCLDKCRSPFSFVIEHWQGRHDSWHAFRLGVDHGVFCVGCCWALMLLMFVVGLGSLGWMMILAVLMAVEKNASWGRRISAPLGIVLIGWGAALLAFT